MFQFHQNRPKTMNHLKFAAFFLWTLMMTGETFVINRGKPPAKWTENEEIKIFREYLRIPTVHPNIDYRPAVAFLEKQAAAAKLPVKVYYPVDQENPVVVMTWEGSEPELPSIMLNSHMDVVPVFEEYWTHPPFAAEMDENGDIFARGAQDNKANGLQYLAAIRALKKQGNDRFRRTIHIVFVPDEEVGGVRGMAGFVKTKMFKDMNVGFVIDETGILKYSGTELAANYGERSNWKVEFIIHGTSGHGSRYYPNTPGEKLTKLLVKINDFRNEEKRKLNESDGFYGNLTTINLTVLKGGVQNNVVPAEVSVVCDMRISVNTDLAEFEQQLNRWCEEAGGNITINYLSREEKESMTALDRSNPYWVVLKDTAEELGIRLKPNIGSGNTDNRFIRRVRLLRLDRILFTRF